MAEEDDEVFMPLRAFYRGEAGRGNQHERQHEQQIAERARKEQH